MDRTEEFRGIVRLHGVEPLSAANQAGVRSPPLHCAIKIAGILNEIESVVERLTKLTTRKEFSNDPTAAMKNVSECFQTRISAAQMEMVLLKRSIEHTPSTSSHQQQHFKLIAESIQKQISGHAGTFQASIKTHMSHVQERQRRVMKYGQAQTLSVDAAEAPPKRADAGFSSNASGSATGSGGGGGGYAMFSKLPLAKPSASVDADQNAPGATQLRRRVANTASQGLGGSVQQVVAQKAAVRNDSMLRQSQKVEKSIAQMGELFSQMANLVMAQSETITRIEDDVESGLSETLDAHKSMEQFYEITKGNRSLIIKIFLIMIFVAFMFLYWFR